jgi:hypothetical protein
MSFALCNAAEQSFHLHFVFVSDPLQLVKPHLESPELGSNLKHHSLSLLAVLAVAFAPVNKTFLQVHQVAQLFQQFALLVLGASVLLPDFLEFSNHKRGRSVSFV